MKSRTVIIHALVWGVVAGLGGLNLSDLAGGKDGDFPRKPIEIVVPFPAGGGTDTLARFIQKAITDNDLAGVPVVIFNKPGASGTIGSRDVLNSKPDGYKILLLHEAIITSKLSRAVPFGPDDFDPIALMTSNVMTVIVREDSPFKDLPSLMKAAVERPGEVSFAANRFSPAHFSARKLELAVPGAEFNISSTGGGQVRHAQIMGGHLDGGMFSLAEYVKYRAPEGTPPDQNIRALAVLEPERVPGTDVPTAIEQGVDVVTSNSHYWWAPKGTPPERIEKLAEILRKAMETEFVQEELKKQNWGLVYKEGDELKTWLDDRVESLSGLDMGQKVDLPNFPLYTICLLGLLAGMMVVQAFGGSRRDAKQIAKPASYTKRPAMAWAALATLVVYLFILQWKVLPFAVATALFVFVSGGWMARWKPRFLLVLAEIALIAGFGAHFVFTRVFTVALP